MEYFTVKYADKGGKIYFWDINKSLKTLYCTIILMLRKLIKEGKETIISVTIAQMIIEHTKPILFKKVILSLSAVAGY